MFQKKDMKSYLQLTSSKILNILKISPRLFILPFVVIYPTNKCNYDCIMCESARSKKGNRTTMNFQLLKRILEELSGFIFKPGIHFSGLGEPLLHPKIISVMQFCKKKNLRWSMTTNGYLLEKYAKHLILNKCRALNISIHGTALEHEKIVNTPDSFTKVLKGLQTLNKIKNKFRTKLPVVAVNCVINNANIFNLDKIVDKFTDLPINSITFQNLSFYKNDVGNNKKFLIHDMNKLNKLTEFMDMVEKHKYPIKINFYPKVKKEDIVDYYTNQNFKIGAHCIFPWLAIRIYPNADVFFCNQNLGNLMNNPVKKIINSPKAIRFRDLVRKGKYNAPDCYRCCHKHYS